MNPLPPDPYKILGIAPDAQLPDIRAAHRKLVKLCHPDKVAADASDDERKEKEDEFKRVQKAYELLSDENERRKYDDKVRLHKRYQDIRRAAAGVGAFSSTVPRWEGGSSTVHVNIRTAEPRPETFASKSPPRDGPEPYHRSPKPSPEQARPDRPKPNIGLKHTNEARHARRSPSYESHPSPTEESEAARQRAMEEKEKDLARRERKLKEAEKALKTEKRPAEKPSRSKEERASRKSKETYIEEPQKGTEDVYLSKSAKVKSSSKPHKSHRSSKHERSRSRSASRPVEKPIKKKESISKPRLQPEIEEPEDTDTGVDSGADDPTRKMKSAMNSAINYIGGVSSSKLKSSKTFHGGDFPPSAPTPPPTAPGHPPPPPTERVVPNIVNAEPRHVPQPPKLNRSTTAPQPTTYGRPIPISVPGEPQYAQYDGSPNNGRLRSSRLAQNFFPDEEDMPVDEMRGPRSRRGSSNAYSAQPHSYSRQPVYPVVAEEYYQSSAQAQYYAGASSHSPKHHVMPGVRHVHSNTAPAPFRTVQTSPAYGYDDVNYSPIPHGYSGVAFS